jgi:hypothetical protein
MGAKIDERVHALSAPSAPSARSMSNKLTSSSLPLFTLFLDTFLQLSRLCFFFLLLPHEFASIMGRQSRQKQHLKRLTTMKPEATYLTLSAEEEESSSGGEEVIWSDEELDQQAETTYKKLFHGVSTLPSKRPRHYTGNSKRTKQRHRAEGKLQAAKNGQTILNFFSPIDVSTSNATVGEDFVLDNEHDSVIEEDGFTSEPDDVEADSDSSSLEDDSLTNELILNIERRLNSTMAQEQQWRLAAVLQYLRLLKFQHSKMKASLCIARQLGRNEYLARRIRSWASLLYKGDDIPVSMRGKHVKVKSLLEEEDVQHEVVQYLRTSKFEFYLADFVHYVSHNVFPNLGISQETSIWYEHFICYSFMHRLHLCCCF